MEVTAQKQQIIN